MLPPPEVLEKYEEISPGFLAWHMKIISDEAEHVREAEKAAYDFDMTRLSHEATIIRRGQLFGLLIGLFALAAGSYVAISGAELGGSLIGSGGVIGLVAVFVFGRKSAANVEKTPGAPSASGPSR